jgi:hypothetical protein
MTEHHANFAPKYNPAHRTSEHRIHTSTTDRGFEAVCSCGQRCRRRTREQRNQDVAAHMAHAHAEQQALAWEGYKARRLRREQRRAQQLASSEEVTE